MENAPRLRKPLSAPSSMEVMSLFDMSRYTNEPRFEKTFCWIRKIRLPFNCSTVSKGKPEKLLGCTSVIMLLPRLMEVTRLAPAKILATKMVREFFVKKIPVRTVRLVNAPESMVAMLLVLSTS